MTEKKGIDMEKKEEKVGVLLSDYQEEQSKKEKLEKESQIEGYMPVTLTKVDILENKRDAFKKSDPHDDMPMELINRHTEEAQQDSKDENFNRGFSVGIVILVIIGLIALVLFVKIATWSIPGATKAILLGLLLLFAGIPLIVHWKSKRKEKEKRLNEMYLGKPSTKIHKPKE